MGRIMVVVLIMLALLLGYLGAAFYFGWVDGEIATRVVIVCASGYVLYSMCSLLMGALKGKLD